MQPAQKFKHLSFELIDIGLFQGQKGLEYIKQTPAYTLTDKYIHYDEKYQTAKEKSVQLYKFLNDKVYSPLRKNIIVIYDQSTNYISFMVKVIQEHQGKMLDYIRDHYTNVQVFVKDSWMHLDFNKDGHVSMEDIRKGVHELYDFMMHYEYLQKAIEIKNRLFDEAIKYMQKDLQQDERRKESRLDENDQKVLKALKDE
jgi:glycerol-3-phosphate O-acyltransferase